MAQNENIRDEIPAYVAGTLDPEIRSRVEDYLERDPDARAMVAHWSAIARGLRAGGKELLTPHPDTAVLSEFARDPEGSSRDISRHVKSCASCGLELAALRARRTERPSTTTVSWAKLHRLPSLAAAAGIVLGVAIGVLVEIPGPGRAPAESGPRVVDLVTLDPSLRGDEDSISIVLRPGQSVVPMVTAPVLPHDARVDELFRFSLLAHRDEPVWFAELTAGAIHESLERSGVVTFLVPADRLPAGRYAIELRAAGADRPLFEVPFEVRTER